MFPHGKEKKIQQKIQIFPLSSPNIPVRCIRSRLRNEIVNGKKSGNKKGNAKEERKKVNKRVKLSWERERSRAEFPPDGTCPAKLNLVAKPPKSWIAKWTH
jgi:hypothetical protein